MPVHFSEISIPRIAPLGGGNWHLQKLTDVTVLFGKNGSGKSLMLRAWRDLSEINIHYVTPERTGEMDFQAQYLQQELTPQNRKNSSSRNYVPEYRRRIIGRIQSYFLVRGDYRGEGSAPASPTEIESFVNSLVTDFFLNLVASGVPPYILTRQGNEQQITGVDQLSSGEAQLVTIGLDILTIAAIWEIQLQSNRVLLIDEPDAHIHPDLQVRFADFVFRIVQRFKLQIVIATHSTSLLASLGQFGGTDTSVIYVNRNKLEYSAQAFGEIHKVLSACLGGHALMGPLFGSPILLVEGDDDYRIWSQVPRHYVIDISVIPSNGEEIKRYQKALEQIFTSLREADNGPCGFALLDGDKTLPTPNPQNPQKHVPFIQLACREAENLYLTDQVMSEIGITWDEAKNIVVQRSSEFGEKTKMLSQAATWDRKHTDIKRVINEIAQIVDAKPIHWTVRVGRAIGRSRPEGQLAEFLGDAVLHSLWGPKEEETISV